MASALVKDAGTLQIGIGALGDAIVYCLQLRHQHNATWQSVLDDCRVHERFGPQIEQIGDTERFERGLYGCTEMFVDDPLGLAGLCCAILSAQGPMRPPLLPTRRACRSPDDRLSASPFKPVRTPCPARRAPAAGRAAHSG